jgi:hypothetical protein
MTIEAWLTGRPSDLDTLAGHFGSGDPSVGRNEDGDYYLTSESFSELWGLDE